ncbi:MAG: FAD-binding oxidoreductase [Burkholderiales bacterium]
MNRLPQPLLDKLAEIYPREQLFTDPVDCYAYAYDNARTMTPPQAVAFAINAKQIRETVIACNEYRVPLTPRGRGTGTAGGSVPVMGGIVLSLERMRRGVAIDPDNRVAIAEAGMLNREVQEAALPHGLFWPPDPSSADYCSIGGNLATCAGGPHAVKYGVARDHVLGLRAVTGTGALIKTGCYTTKGVVGYDLTRLIVGSEGTLAVITEATLKLSPLPRARAGITAHYKDPESCAQAIAAIMRASPTPSALEFLDEGSLNLLRPRLTIPAESLALLMIEVDGGEHEVAEAAEIMLSRCENSGLISARPAEDAATLWRARKMLSPLLREIAPKKINEDVVVPVSHLPALLAGLAGIARKQDIAIVNFGHAGNGNLHVNLLVDAGDPDQMRRAKIALSEIFDLALGLNGTLSGEHGIGSEKRDFVAREIDAETLDLMQALKRAFDPNNVLNPGKLFP